MSTPPDIDRAVDRVLGGDADAFGDVLRHYAWPVRTWVATRCPPGADADDVAQNTFVEAFKNIGKYQVGTDFGKWLFTIARYQVMAECKRLQRRGDNRKKYAPHALTQALLRRVESAEAEPEPRMELLRRCVEQLGDAAKAVLDQRYDQGVPLAVIAESTGRSVAAIKKQLFVVRHKLRDCVQSKLAEGAGP